MLNSRDELAKLIPHGDAMSVIDRVVFWDSKMLTAETEAHQRLANPIFASECSSILLVEYAAQAAAVHAGLNQVGLGVDRPAYLGAVKNVSLHVEKLTCSQPLMVITVVSVLSDSNGAIYEMSVAAGDVLMVTGRLVLIQP